MADSGQPTSYSCKCLNVQLTATVPPSPNNSPGLAEADGYTSVYVGDEGIDIAHTQMTLRNRGPRTQRKEENCSLTTRFVSLICLVCQTVVYRVSQPVLPDVDISEGPLLPTEDWVESEILQSSKGWVQVSKDCLSGNSLQEAKNSPSYSKLFRIVLSAPHTAASGTETYYVTPPPASPEGPSTPRNLLPYIPNLFPPPPFTPTHPVFVHLSGLATAESERLRSDAEDQLRKIVEDKVAELKAADAKLKQGVENLWLTFKASVADVDNASNKPRPSISRQSISKHGHSQVNGVPASVRVQDFEPAAVPPPRMPVAASAPTVSALSASLATTSSLHHAMAARSGSSSRDTTRPQSASRASTRSTDSPSTASAGVLIDGEAEIREAYRRNMDQSLDFATSYKYMMDIGAHVQGRRQEVPGTVPEEDEANNIPSPSSSAVPRGRSPRASKSAIKKPKAEGNSTPATASQRTSSEDGEHHAAVAEAPTTPKGKRKVTFDVKPEVTIIASETPKVNGGKRPKAEGESRVSLVAAQAVTDVVFLSRTEAVFDMENESPEDAVDVTAQPSPAPSQPESPIAEPSQPPRRGSRRAASWSGLPSSFSTLRPSSLPMPSAIRPTAPVEHSDDRARSQSIKTALLSPVDGEVKRREIHAPRELQEEEQVTDPHEAEILKLVAASTPSHRSAWKKDSSAWRTFVARQRSPKHQRSMSIPEEDESSATDGPAYYDESGDDSGQDDEQKDFWSKETSIATSLPIPIGPLGKGTKPTAPSSYQPKTAVPEKPEAFDKATAAAMRRASYAERDRNRSLDPGALDFTADEDELDEEDEEMSKPEAEVGARSLQRALKILQKRSEMPGDGMWRSLA
ncbi:hypothetical protein BC835DRAFT_1518032 [Cytidiella melzeri]|nr:hypothetical protein BC835DRAFT_1518032 [Cytidiella melzeri]